MQCVCQYGKKAAGIALLFPDSMYLDRWVCSTGELACSLYWNAIEVRLHSPWRLKSMEEGLVKPIIFPLIA